MALMPKRGGKALIARAVGLACLVVSPAAAETPPLEASGSFRLELIGPAARCGLPARFNFGASDAITYGKVTVGGRFYAPRGRLQPETGQLRMQLVRWERGDDPAPIVRIRAQVNGTPNGEWIGRGDGCSGQVRVLRRER